MDQDLSWLSGCPDMSGEIFCELYERMKQAEDPKEAEQIRRHILAGNIRLVASIAARIPPRKRCGLEVSDLISLGFIGLNRALEKFDPTFGATFGTYAYRGIRQAIRNGIKDGSLNRPYRIPRQVQDRLYTLEACLNDLRAELKQVPRLEQIRQKCHQSDRPTLRELAPEEIDQDIELLFRPKASSSTKQDADGQVRDIMETICSDGLNPEEAFVRMQEAQVDHLLSQLTPKELFIIQQRFGLDDGGERTLQDIGDELGVTRECIRKIEARALKKMRCHAGAMVEP